MGLTGLGFGDGGVTLLKGTKYFIKRIDTTSTYFVSLALHLAISFRLSSEMW
ncbi:hypothetical protein ACLOJK_021292 [Asimina triloba]